MGALERHTQVFIVRIWQEPREVAGAEAICRGVVEHAASGQRGYVADLDEITTFIGSFVEGRFEKRRGRSRLLAWLRGRGG